MFLTHLCLPISQIGQAALLQAFRLCGTENIETVEIDLEKLISVTSYSDSIMNWSRNKSNIGDSNYEDS